MLLNERIPCKNDFCEQHIGSRSNILDLLPSIRQIKIFHFTFLFFSNVDTRCFYLSFSLFALTL